MPFLEGMRAHGRRAVAVGAGEELQEKGRAIGVRNNDGRAEESAETSVGRNAARKKTRG